MSAMRIIMIVVFLLPAGRLQAQVRPDSTDDATSWMALQLIPGMSWTVHDGTHNFGFEWEAAPLLYAFGMTNLVSPWHAFRVTPPTRFAGSVEVVATGRLYTHKLDHSYWGAAVGLLGHLPLVEYGEYLGLTAGVERQWFGARRSDFVVGGVSVLFGFIEYNIHFSPRDRYWIHQVAVRMF